MSRIGCHDAFHALVSTCTEHVLDGSSVLGFDE